MTRKWGGTLSLRFECLQPLPPVGCLLVRGTKRIGSDSSGFRVARALFSQDDPRPRFFVLMDNKREAMKERRTATRARAHCAGDVPRRDAIIKGEIREADRTRDKEERACGVR